METKHKRRKDLFNFVIISILFLTYLLYAEEYEITIYTPEGRSLTAHAGREEFSLPDIVTYNAYGDNIVSGLGLKAKRIGDADNSYNCHAYAWRVSEGLSKTWIGYEEDDEYNGHPEMTYWLDEDYANDDLPSYLCYYDGVTESEATQAWVGGDINHSSRKIQNGYPIAIDYTTFPGTPLDYVSKWGPLGLYQHAKGQDMFLQGDPDAIEYLEYFKLKTEHSGDLSDSDESTDQKTWIGAGGQIHTITDNDIVIPSNLTLTILPGTIVKIASGKKIQVNGTLIAEGTAENPIIFTSNNATPSAGDWYGIRFEDSSVDENCIMEYCEIQYADYGIYCNRANPTIQNSSISNSDYGIYLYYSSPDIETNSITDCSTGIYGTSSSPAITDNLIRGHSSQGVSFSGGSPVFYNNTIDENYYGALFVGTSCPEFGPTFGSNEGNNDIHHNTYYGIYGQYFSEIFMGSHDYQDNRIGGYNSICYNTVGDAVAYCLTDFEAEYNWWGVSPIRTASYYSSINYANELGSDPYGGSSLAKSTTLAKDKWEGFNPNNPDYDNLSDLWLLGEHLFIHDQLEEAISAYKMLVNKFSGDDYAIRALVKIKHLYNKTGKDQLTGYLCGLLQNSKIDTNVHQLIYPLLIDAYLSDRDVNSAVDLAKTVMDKYPNSVTEKITLYNMTLAMLNDSKDIEAALKYVGLLKQKYPEDELTYMAREAMGEEVKWSLEKPVFEPEPADVSLPDRYALHNNYPNPFNPQTTIRYQLSDAGHVKLQVFDLSGRLVQTLVDESKPAGEYSITWHAEDVSSGIYFYRLETRGFSAVQKCIKLK